MFGGSNSCPRARGTCCTGWLNVISCGENLEFCPFQQKSWLSCNQSIQAKHSRLLDPNSLKSEKYWWAIIRVIWFPNFWRKPLPGTGYLRQQCTGCNKFIQALTILIVEEKIPVDLYWSTCNLNVTLAVVTMVTLRCNVNLGRKMAGQLISVQATKCDYSKSWL